MKKTVNLLLCLLLVSSTALAQEKRKSPAQTVTGKIGDTEITIKYSAPSVKGREIFGGLEPYGKVWRAGANEATTIEFSQDVKINGQTLEAGIYAFFTTPTEDGEWPIIFNTEHKQWGAYKLDPDKNALESTATVTEIESKELLTYSISDGMIHLEWSTTRISFAVE